MDNLIDATAQTLLLDNFQWDRSPSLDRETVVKLASLEFIENGGKVIFTGPERSGKSHIANAIRRLAYGAGKTTAFEHGYHLDCDDHYAAMLCQGAFTEAFAADLTIVDDVRPTSHLRSFLRYRPNGATILLTQRPAAELRPCLPPIGFVDTTSPHRWSEKNRLLKDSVPTGWDKAIVVEFKEVYAGSR